MAKPITELTKDIRKLIEDGRAVLDRDWETRGFTE